MEQTARGSFAHPLDPCSIGEAANTNSAAGRDGTDDPAPYRRLARRLLEPQLRDHRLVLVGGLRPEAALLSAALGEPGLVPCRIDVIACHAGLTSDALLRRFVATLWRARAGSAWSSRRRAVAGDGALKCIILDHADELSPEALDEICRFSSCSYCAGVMLILLVRPGFLNRLDASTLEPLKRAASIELDAPLSAKPAAGDPAPVAVAPRGHWKLARAAMTALAVAGLVIATFHLGAHDRSSTDDRAPTAWTEPAEQAAPPPNETVVENGDRSAASAVPSERVVEAERDAPASTSPEAGSPKAPAELLPADEIRAFVERGDELLAMGDIVAARGFYERAAETGDGRAATAAGKTLDPLFLAQNGIFGLRGDPAEAAAWYRRASSRGDAEAGDRLAQLVAKYPKS